MSGETPITIIGRLTDDPALRFIQSGSPVANFSVAHNSRKFNKQKNEWEDSEATFYRCSMWGTGAENVAETLRKGSPVIVYGFIGTRSWEQNGERKSAMEVKVERIGLDLTFVKVDAANVINSRGNSGGQSATQQSDVSAPGGSANDPWASSPTSSSEPPF
jgi:single-strand DNA-binding protein